MNDPPPDVEALRLPSAFMGAIEELRGRKTPRPQKGEKFLKGPISWAWLAQAARLPGQTLHVGLAIWFLAGLRKARQVPLSLSSLDKLLGVKRDAARRGLAALKGAGLVEVEQQCGRKPIVTILTAPVIVDRLDQ